MTKDKQLKSSADSGLAKALGGDARYRIKRIERVGKDGQKEYKAVCVEVDDLEKFRKKLKGRKYTDVFFVYEKIG